MGADYSGGQSSPWAVAPRGRKEGRKEGSFLFNRPWRSMGLWAIEAPTFSRQLAHRRQWGCRPYMLAAPYPQEDFWYSFLLEAESTPGPRCSWKIRSIEKSNDFTRNQTRKVLDCSTVPQSDCFMKNVHFF
jgi:hypothetical protein